MILTILWCLKVRAIMSVRILVFRFSWQGMFRCGLVCCDTVESCTWILVFRKNHVLSPLPPSTVMTGHLPSNPRSEVCVCVFVFVNDAEDVEII